MRDNSFFDNFQCEIFNENSYQLILNYQKLTFEESKNEVENETLLKFYSII